MNGRRCFNFSIVVISPGQRGSWRREQVRKEVNARDTAAVLKVQ